MTIQDLGSVGEFVAAVATVATLLYLAIQLRNNSRVTRFEGHLETRKMLAESQRLIAEPDKARIWNAGLRDPSSLGEDELSSFYSIMFLLVNAIDAGLEYQRVTHDKDFYRPQGDFLAVLATQPGFKQWWSFASNTFNSDLNRRVATYMLSDGSDPVTRS